METGRIARQATGSVLITMGKTSVLTTVVMGKNENDNFFPLTVNYQERTYATGRIPGGFFKREGRPSEKEILTCRLIDRPIRPLFPKAFMFEVQIVASVVSSDKSSDPDICAMLGASAALAISGIPFNGPIGAARVGIVPDEGYILNPNYEQTRGSQLDMVVAGTEKAVLMVESQANELSEDLMLGSVLFAHKEMQVAISAINEFAAAVGTKPIAWQAPEADANLQQQLSERFAAEIEQAYTVVDKQQRNATLAVLREQIHTAYGEDAPADLKDAIAALERDLVRSRILAGKPRIDGRDLTTVRDISIDLGLLPMAHGSALFTRGETQVIATVTLASKKSSQMIDALEGEYFDNLMLHYNFPPYCVGETGMMTGPKRREIGHGRLARRGITAVLPNQETEFPYTIRIVSEVTESNGSSSMASVCGSSLALMDAGVPVRKSVAGIAMGLVKAEDGRYAVLTDILGDEDHLGDMDFKVAGTADGVTALQMDIKIEGINAEIMERALSQAQEARLQILQKMESAIDKPRAEVAETAPVAYKLQINPEKVREVIGKGGATIKRITESTGCEINIESNGEVHIYADSRSKSQAAIAEINSIAQDPEVGAIYSGEVVRILDFGAVVAILNGNRDGLVHISEIDATKRVNKVEDYLQLGQKVDVKLLQIENTGRLRLSIKAALSPQ